MTIYKNIPYTYLIGWSELNIFYYGVRYSKRCNPRDLFVTYFTSSNAVKQKIKSFGMPDVIQIRKTFKDSDSARLWEHKVLRRLKVAKSDVFLNMHDSKSFPVMFGENNPMYGRSRPDSSARMRTNNPMKDPAIAKKVSEANTGRPSPNKGRPNPEQSLKFTNNNPMKNPECVKKMLKSRKPEDSGKGMIWVANILTKKRARMFEEQLQLEAVNGWIKLSNTKPIPDIDY